MLSSTPLGKASLILTDFAKKGKRQKKEKKLHFVDQTTFEPSLTSKVYILRDTEEKSPTVEFDPSRPAFSVPTNNSSSLIVGMVKNSLFVFYKWESRKFYCVWFPCCHLIPKRKSIWTNLGSNLCPLAKKPLSIRYASTSQAEPTPKCCLPILCLLWNHALP